MNSSNTFKIIDIDNKTSDSKYYSWLKQNFSLLFAYFKFQPVRAINIQFAMKGVVLSTSFQQSTLKSKKAELKICFFAFHMLFCYFDAFLFFRAFLLFTCYFAILMLFCFFLRRHLPDRALHYALNTAPYRENSKKAKKHQNLISKKAALNSKKAFLLLDCFFAWSNSALGLLELDKSFSFCKYL